MWHNFKYYARRARELLAAGEFTRALSARIRAWVNKAPFKARQVTRRTYKEYSANLPAGFPAKRITLRLSVPPLPVRPPYAFSEHVADEQGHLTDTVLAVATGGFAVSGDLGRTWKIVRVDGHSRHSFVQIKAIGDSEFLAQALPPEGRANKTSTLDILIVNERGMVLAKHPAQGHRWHGCRGVGFANGTLMYAEYPSNIEVKGRRPSNARVLRSRDRGRHWEVVFERGPEQIRHFHFLQARAGVPGEWWLTSGDYPHESHIWVSNDDGDSWTDVSDVGEDSIEIAGTKFNRSIFRLTDLIWTDGEVVWATDDYLGSIRPPGARVFRSKIAETLKPELVGIGKWHFRNIVDIGDFFLLISQRSNQRNRLPEDLKPGVYLMPKNSAPGSSKLVHLFNLDAYPSNAKAGFTFSKASRATKNGTFFSFRSSELVFPAGHKILEWNVCVEQ